MLIKDNMRVMWLLICICGHLLRARLPMSPMMRIWHKSRSLNEMRELRAIYAKHGIKLNLPC